MPSTPSPNLRLELQETGEALNTWGTRLNTAIELVEDAITGVFSKALTGNYTLSTVLYDVDEARNAVLIFTDGGLTAMPTVTIPNVQKLYYVENRATAFGIQFTSGNGMGVLPAGRRGFVICDGTNVAIFDPVALADSARIGSEAARDTARAWAVQLGQAVVDDFSAKEYAIGSDVPSGSAREWAVTTGVPVAGGEFAAKEYASGSAVPSGSSREWSTTVGATVDGVEYAAREYASGDLTATGGSAKAWATDVVSPDGSAAKSARTLAGEAESSAVTAGERSRAAQGFALFAQNEATRAEDEADRAAALAQSVDGPAIAASIAAARFEARRRSFKILQRYGS